MQVVKNKKLKTKTMKEEVLKFLKETANDMTRLNEKKTALNCKYGLDEVEKLISEDSECRKILKNLKSVMEMDC